MTKNSKNIIAFMGIAGANADLACRISEPYMETLPCDTFDDVFLAVREGKASRGLVPIENSHAGRVAEIHNLLPQMGLHIVGEHFLAVKHTLAGIKGAQLVDIKEVYSHPQALMQCKGNLQKLKAVPCASSNTAGAALNVSKWADKSKAALCTDLAAELYGLEPLKSDMQDNNINITTFIKVAIDLLDEEELDGVDNILTSILFELRNIPSALYKALGGFATNKVNMVKLESYISSGVAPTAQFLMTFEGKPSEIPVQNALDELSFFTQKVTILGVYPADKDRTSSAL